jgi:hypothetical protein
LREKNCKKNSWNDSFRDCEFELYCILSWEGYGQTVQGQRVVKECKKQVRTEYLCSVMDTDEDMY